MPNKYCVFFGGIPKNVPEKKILAYFQQFGDISELSLDPLEIGQNEDKHASTLTKEGQRDSNKKDLHRGCGYVTFTSQEAYKEVLEETHKIRGVQFDCKKAMSRQEKYFKDISEVKQRRKIFLPKLPKNVTKKALKDYFSLFGKIEGISFISAKNRSSFAFITFTEPYKGMELIKLPLFIVRGKINHAEFSTKGLRPKDMNLLKNDIEEFLERFRIKIGEYFREEKTQNNHMETNLRISLVTQREQSFIRLRAAKNLEILNEKCFYQGMRKFKI